MVMMLMNLKQRKYKIKRNKKSTAKDVDIDAIIFEIMDYNPI